jgi:hypothetical protein
MSCGKPHQSIMKEHPSYSKAKTSPLLKATEEN